MMSEEHTQSMSKMMNLMYHRGPDNKQIYSHKNVILGHCRLSIIDKSNDANQPMQDQSGRFVLIYNGEVYNYLELRNELQHFGYYFKTKSDAEVILYAFIQWGAKALEKFQGMFAGCFYDNKLEKLLVFRDRFGQKPIYFRNINSNVIAFSSEIKPLLSLARPIEVNGKCWSRYIIDAKYDDDAETMFAEIGQLLPGQYFIITKEHKIYKNKWYNLRENIDNSSLDFSSATDKLTTLLEDVTSVHMRSDVEVGICLSGGLDSSLLASFISHSELGKSNLKCLSVEFENELTERQWINSVASQFNFESEILNFTIDDFFNSIKPMMWHLEGPIGGLMNCAMTKVFARSHELGIRVMQDGTGLDEGFGGYQHHHNLYLQMLIEENQENFDERLLEYSKNWGLSTEETKKKIILSKNHPGASLDGTIPYRHELLKSEYLENYKPNEIHQKQTKDQLLESLINYVTKDKIPRNTRFKDRLSMAYSVELRLPYLDHRIIEFGLSLNPEFFFRGGLSKSILRHCLSHKLTDDIRLARKRSIQAPQGKWLSTPIFREYVNDILDSQILQNLGIFDINKCKKAFAEHLILNSSNSFFIWQWINTFEWYQTFKYDDATKNKCTFPSI